VARKNEIAARVFEVVAGALAGRWPLRINKSQIIMIVNAGS
jgi:hypothetical protein